MSVCLYTVKHVHQFLNPVMRTVALISGGKDSCFNVLQCIAAGHEVVALANLRPCSKEDYELDSYMYQTVGHDAIELYSEATGLPLYRETIRGTSIQQEYEYFHNKDDEVEDLFRLLSRVKEQELVEAVSVGAILSNYQRIRVENVCRRLNLTSLSYLWRRDQEELLGEMIECGIEAILIKVAALGLNPEKYLGKSLLYCYEDLKLLNKKYGLNICGEGGEYETLTLDCPFFKRKIIIEKTEIVPHTKDPIAPVAYLKFPKLRLSDKEVKLNEFSTVKKPSDFCSEELNCPSVSGCDSHEIPTRNSCISVVEQHVSISVQQISGSLFIGGVVVEHESDFIDAMESIKGVLQDKNLDISCLVSMCLYIRDMNDYPQINQIYGQYFNLNPPVRACVQTPMQNFAVIEALALPLTERRKSLHVQSISHWAPANIGPYSQCIQVGELIFLSGLIGLIPGSMTLPSPPNFGAECRLALRHAHRILEAMDTNVNLKNSSQVICFIRDEYWIPEAKSIWKECSTQDVTYAVVSNLPKNALVEWQIIAKIPDEESDEEDIDDATNNRQNKTATMILSIDDPSLSDDDAKEMVTLLESTLSNSCALRVYYRVDGGTNIIQVFQRVLPKSMAVTLVPVWSLESGKLLVICGICC